MKTRIPTHQRQTRWTLPGMALAFLLFGAGWSFGQGTNQPKRLDYSDFRIVTERNIFNPRRYPRSGPRQSQPAKVDAFTLVGTMIYEKGPFAFFEGTSSEYRKVVKPSESIAGYKITNIAINSVKLANSTNEVQLAVGMQMRREEDGRWQVASGDQPLPSSAAAEPARTGSGRGPEATAATAPSVSETPPGTEAASASAAAGGADDVLRRLMQRREQEMNR